MVHYNLNYIIYIQYHIVYIKRTNAYFKTYYPRGNGCPEIRSQVQVIFSLVC